MGAENEADESVLHARRLYSIIEEICYRANFSDDGGKDPLQWNREIVDGLRDAEHDDIAAVVMYLADYNGKSAAQARDDLVLLTRKLASRAN